MRIDGYGQEGKSGGNSNSYIRVSDLMNRRELNVWSRAKRKQLIQAIERARRE